MEGCVISALILVVGFGVRERPAQKVYIYICIDIYDWQQQLFSASESPFYIFIYFMFFFLLPASFAFCHEGKI